MSKRGPDEDFDLDELSAKKPKTYEHVKKHTLDSDEEDSDVDESRWVCYVECGCVFVSNYKELIFSYFCSYSTDTMYLKKKTFRVKRMVFPEWMAMWR